MALQCMCTTPLPKHSRWQIRVMSRCKTHCRRAAEASGGAADVHGPIPQAELQARLGILVYFPRYTTPESSFLYLQSGGKVQRRSSACARSHLAGGAGGKPGTMVCLIQQSITESDWCCCGWAAESSGTAVDVHGPIPQAELLAGLVILVFFQDATSLILHWFTCRRAAESIGAALHVHGPVPQTELPASLA